VSGADVTAGDSPTRGSRHASARIREVSDPNATDTYGELNLNTPGDQLLYHYTSADTAFDYILPTGTLRMNSYRSMRDPLENKDIHKLLRFTDGTEPPGLTLLEAQELVGDIRDQMRIVCLTMDANGYQDDEIQAFGRGYARARMWEHYANRHRGVCLAFSAKCMTETFYEELKKFGAASEAPVTYTMGGFAVSPARLIDAKDLGDRDPARMLTDHVMAHHTDLWALKLSDWDSEYEYRFVVFVPTAPLGEAIHVSFVDCLRAIVLGECFDPALLDRARQLAMDLRVGLCQIDWDGGRPSLSAVR
jgi:hypothetical protein